MKCNINIIICAILLNILNKSHFWTFGDSNQIYKNEKRINKKHNTSQNLI